MPLPKKRSASKPVNIFHQAKQPFLSKKLNLISKPLNLPKLDLTLSKPTILKN